MKKIIIFLILLIPIRINANSIVMDSDTNRVLYCDNCNEVRLIASISKIMTCIVAINNSNLDDIVTIDQDVLKSFGSGIYIEVGEQIKLKDLLYGLMLRSGNDAAIEIANYVGGSMDGFVKLMNDTSKEIGMNSTNFVNSSGLEENNGTGNTSTCLDMAKLMSYTIKNKTFKKIISTKKYTLKTNYKSYIWYNKNKLLNNYEYCTGGKTGYTEKARRTLVTSASKDNMNLVIVTLNESDDFNKHKSLYEEYFSKYSNYKIIDKKNIKLKKDTYYVKKDYYATLTKEEYKNIDTSITYYNKNVSDIVGDISIKLNNEIINKVYIYEKIIRYESKKKNIFYKIKDYIKG